eukprot:TRINITY_DN18187_c0_g1_i1.p1 TRINITY_DN18187_c0_g1~~TRINITY_DN18187_c0_g1_i1.p1  ORF type:complete len:811 (+),score=90.02 TRINITY_DN18187_c0_g1_i1:217-2649(+)
MHGIQLFVLYLCWLCSIAHGKTQQIANLNWHSGDLLGGAIQVLMESRGLSAERQGVEQEYQSSAAAMDGLRAGQVDIVPECWASCDNGSVVSQRLGAHAFEGIFLPSYVTDGSPHLLDWTSPNASQALFVAGVKVIAPPREAWPTSWSITAAVAKMVDVPLVSTSSSSDLIDRILEALKMRQRVAFYMWVPHIVTATYDVKAVKLPATEAGLWEPIDLRVVWSSGADARVNALLSSGLLTASNDDINEMVRALTAPISWRAVDGTATYEHALQASARGILCQKKLVDEWACEAPSLWPRQKSPDLPARVKISMKNCPPFAWCPATAEEFAAPSGGYSVDHLHEVMHLIGYQRHEYTMECLKTSTNELVKRAAKDLTDMAHACITISSTRQRQVDFSAAFFSTGLRFLILKPQTKWWAPMFWMFSPFHWSMWLAVVLTTFAIGAMLGIARACQHRQAPASESESDSNGASPATGTSSLQLHKSNTVGELQRRSISNAMLEVWKVSSARFGSGNHKAPAYENYPAPARTALNALSVALYFVGAMYMASLTADMTVERASSPIRGVDDLYSQKVGILCDTTVESWLADNHPQVQLVCGKSFRDLKSRLLSQEIVAVVYDAPVLESMQASDPECRFQAVGELIFLQEYGIAFPKKHPLREAASAAVTYMGERNDRERLQKKHFAGHCKTFGSELNRSTIAYNQMLAFVPIVAVALLRCLVEALCTCRRGGKYAFCCCRRRSCPSSEDDSDDTPAPFREDDSCDGESVGSSRRNPCSGNTSACSDFKAADKEEQHTRQRCSKTDIEEPSSTMTSL